MRRILALSVVALALTAISAGALYAADAKATGSVTGKVVDKESNPVAGVTVVAATPPAGGDKKNNVEAKESRKESLKDRTVAQTTTAADGTFTLTGVPAGKIIILARKDGTGMARTIVEVKAGETTTINAPLTLNKPVDGHKGGGEKKGPGEHKKDKK